MSKCMWKIMVGYTIARFSPPKVSDASFKPLSNQESSLEISTAKGVSLHLNKQL